MKMLGRARIGLYGCRGVRPIAHDLPPPVRAIDTNGAGAYKFRVTVRDGDLIGQADRFEIRILPAGSTDFSGTPLWKGGNDLTGSHGAGSIVIHH